MIFEREWQAGWMKDTQLYEQILGVQAPWKVESVELNQEAGEIEVRVGCEQTRWKGESGERLHVHGYEERRWRHLDSCQYRTYLKAKVPRLKYPDGRTELVRVPWAEKNSRFTLLFERLAIDLLLECSVKAACAILRISWDAADGIKQRAVRPWVAPARRSGPGWILGGIEWAAEGKH